MSVMCIPLTTFGALLRCQDTHLDGKKAKATCPVVDPASQESHDGHRNHAEGSHREDFDLSLGTVGFVLSMGLCDKNLCALQSR
jgi:hypothetical protein